MWKIWKYNQLEKLEAARAAWHRRSWVIFRGGPTIPSCQNSILSCQHFFLSGGAKFFNSVLPSYRAKLLCQTVLPIGKSCKWMAEKQAKMKEKIAEINQKWQKTDKNDRKTGKMWSFTNYHLPSSHFCPAKLPFLSCQALISVLPRSHFCPAKLTNFSWGGQGPPPPPPNYA